MKSITPFLWYNTEADAEEAPNFYVSLLGGKITHTWRGSKHVSESMNQTPGTLVAVNFEILGRSFTAFNGGPMYKFSPATSIMVTCETQEEIDRLWDAFCDGGEPQACGWLTDKWGMSWQIVPDGLMEMLQDPDPEVAGRKMAAMMSMVKFDIAALRDA